MTEEKRHLLAISAFAASILLVMVPSGCTLNDSQGRKHHVIFGFGVVTVDSQPAAQVVTSNVAGMELSNHAGPRATLGISSITITDVRSPMILEVNTTNLTYTVNVQ